MVQRLHGSRVCEAEEDEPQDSLPGQGVQGHTA